MDFEAEYNRLLSIENACRRLQEQRQTQGMYHFFLTKNIISVYANCQLKL